MPDVSFRGKPVDKWLDADFQAFCRHLTDDVLSRPSAPANAKLLPDDTKPHSVFDSAKYQGQPGSPFEWHRDVKSRLGQAEMVNQDLGLLKQCIEAGRFAGMDDKDSMAVFDGMASKMATVRYGYAAGSNPKRAEDYKSHMATAMAFGGIDLIEDDINEWRSEMQALLNNEYDKATKPNSRYICRFFVRDNPGEEFNRNGGCVFYETGLLDAYVQEYVHNRIADMSDSKQSVKDLFRFTTAPDDYDTKYRITKVATLAQGGRVMSKESWINNLKAQTVFSNMVGWGFGGNKFAETMMPVHESAIANDGAVWLELSKARIARANKLYEDLDALSELPLDSHGSLRFQPSVATCEKSGWIPADAEKKPGQKAREAAFNRELLVRTADVLYGTQIAEKVQKDLRFISKIPAAPGESKNDLQQVWDAIQSGDFNSVKDRVIAWSGERLDIIEQESMLIARGDAPLYTGLYANNVCRLYSKDGAIACTGDILRNQFVSAAPSVDRDGLDLPTEDMDLMYRVYCESAKINGIEAVEYDSWSAMVNSNPNLNLLRGESSIKRAEVVRPAPVLPKDQRPERHAPAPSEFINQAEHENPDIPEPSYIGNPETDNPEMFEHVPDEDFNVPPELMGSLFDDPVVNPAGQAGLGRNTRDLDAAAEEILQFDQVDQSEQELFESLQ